MSINLHDTEERRKKEKKKKKGQLLITFNLIYLIMTQCWGPVRKKKKNDGKRKNTSVR